ncbi:hypothetical protein NL676_013400 [Syzygium grande]|nr:hypothetical protein NL676_013400 [Syzygium grande]
MAETDRDRTPTVPVVLVLVLASLNHSQLPHPTIPRFLHSFATACSRRNLRPATATGDFARSLLERNPPQKSRLFPHPGAMVRLSSSLVGILNLVTFLLSVPILGAGKWLSKRASNDCEKFLERPVIALGVFLMLVSLAGLVGACCRVSWLLWLYLLVMFLLIVLLFCFTVFAFVVTNKGAGEALGERGYKEYRLGDYSHWLQKRVNSTKNWNKIRSCLSDGKVCSSFQDQYLNDTVEKFYTEHLSALQVSSDLPIFVSGSLLFVLTFWVLS